MRTYTSYYSSPLGSLQIRCSDEHVQVVEFMDDEVREEACEHALLQTCSQQLSDYFSGRLKEFDLPLQQTGTPFQQKVWDLLLQIPFGKTISYNTLSRQYGDLKAIRAVASANGKNNLAIIVPCHRVIGSNRSLTGYAGGLWRKKWLLEHEAKHHSGVMTLF
ncbi:MAG: methylated-DNA--[protein]-cysteine S-methyltransferase [Gammaproteobacteria bacterium]|nr:MAG: methylated-DNA--[protein]-cysteine S-methyltransferase [Gammaproteobacteria bacterium]